MEINYNEQQLDELKAKFSFLNKIFLAILFSAIVFGLFVSLGIYLVWISLTLIGVLTCAVFLLPFIVSIMFACMVVSIRSMLNKGKFKSFRVKCLENQTINGSPLWRLVTIQNVGQVYVYVADPLAELSSSTDVDVLIHEKKKSLRLGILSLK